MNSVTEFKCGLGFTKTIFWGKGFGKTSADSPLAERGLGNECGRACSEIFLENRPVCVYYISIL